MDRSVIFRKMRVEQGLCSTCGKENDRGKGWYCSSCLEKYNEESRKTRRKLVELGICPYCRKERLYENEKMCLDCLFKRDEYMRTHGHNLKPETIEKARVRKKTKYQELRSQGICVACRQVKTYGKARCPKCLEKNAKVNREKHKSIKTDFSDGLCIRCNEKALPGKCQCEYHNNITVKAGKKSAENRRKKSNEYRKSNAENIRAFTDDFVSEFAR